MAYTSAEVGYSQLEGAFYGNIFNGNTTVRSCYGTISVARAGCYAGTPNAPTTLSYGVLSAPEKGRNCAVEGGDCTFLDRGRCSAVCGTEGPNGYASCEGFTRVTTVHAQPLLKTSYCKYWL
jgi:hypothetical protein